MAEIVVDTSALLAVLLDEPERPGLIAATQGVALSAPGSVGWEVGNGLIAGFRRGRLSARQVEEAWNSFERIPLRTLPIVVSGALVAAQEHGLYAYDAYVLEAARAHRRPLLALDKRLRAVAGEMGLDL